MSRTKSMDEIWFWVGVADEYVNRKARPSLYLGREELRAGFIGARPGGSLSVVIDAGSGGLTLPKKGFLLNDTASVYLGTGADQESVDLDNAHEYEFTILGVCPAMLMHRQDVLRQWGYIPHLWAESPNYPFVREGPLEWIAIEADCDSKKLRIEKGPAYGPASGTLTPNWSESYQTAVNKGRVSARD